MTGKRSGLLGGLDALRQNRPMDEDSGEQEAAQTQTPPRPSPPR